MSLEKHDSKINIHQFSCSHDPHLVEQCKLTFFSRFHGILVANLPFYTIFTLIQFFIPALFMNCYESNRVTYLLDLFSLVKIASLKVTYLFLFLFC